MTSEALLFPLLRSALFGAPVENKIKQACTPEALEDLYHLADLHDVAHLVGQALDKLGLPDSPGLTRCRNRMLQAMYRYFRQDFEYQEVCRVLVEAEIPYIPLKGTVLRPYYPEPWMRTSCDTDILIHREDLEKAQKLIQDKLHYVERRVSPHDVSLISPSHELLELHFAIIEDFVLPKAREILERIWDYAVPVEGKPYEYALPDDLFYYYHMVHMAKHVANGGISVRFFIDTWMLNHKVPHDRKAREAFLKKGYRFEYALATELLTEIWFGDKAMDATSSYYAAFILRGGNFGNLTNRVALRRTKEGGRIKFLMKRIILPYDLIKYYFPILQKHKWLTPWYQIVRWWNLLTKGDLNHSVSEVRAATQYDNSDHIPADVLLKHLGL
ncbi:MAG: hypothetical protein E7527_06740 [Ruminococcaceae bacterium]|nr:hypothetical protein [Oscillospiraceae bacterium]